MQQIKLMVRQEMGQMMGTLLNGRAAASTPVWELPDAVSLSEHHTVIGAVMKWELPEAVCLFSVRRMSQC
jgi:hypothetical protein